MSDKEPYHVNREEWEHLNKKMDEIHTALIGNNLGTIGLIKRLAILENWAAGVKVRLAVIAASIAGGATATIEAVKHAFTSNTPPPGH